MSNGIQDLSRVPDLGRRNDDAPVSAPSAEPGGSLARSVDEIRRIARELRDPVSGPHRREALAGELLRICDGLPRSGAASGAPVSPELRRAYASLSPRELQIFEALAQGLSVGDIAAQLNRSPKTVNNHRTHIMKKLSLRNSAELARLAFRLGVTTL